MSTSKVAKDLMIDVFEFPHIPYWFSIRQAIGIIKKESKEMAEKPISDVMTPAKFFVLPDDPITKAAYLMVHNELALLPVLENNKKFIGLVRMIEVFDELSNTILEERGKIQ